MIFSPNWVYFRNSIPDLKIITVERNASDKSSFVSQLFFSQNEILKTIVSLGSLTILM